MQKREFIKRGFAALSSLAVGETILLTPNDAQAFFWSKKEKALYGQRKAVRRASGRGRLVNDYSKATIVKGVCLNIRGVEGLQREYAALLERIRRLRPQSVSSIDPSLSTSI